MELRPIKTEVQYEKALERLDQVFDSEPGTDEGDELEMLALMIEDYESKNYPIDPPDPIEAIKYRMEQMGLSQNDFAEIIGNKKRVNEILNRKRKLTLKMIRKISAEMNIPPEVLVKEY